MTKIPKSSILQIYKGDISSLFSSEFSQDSLDKTVQLRKFSLKNGKNGNLSNEKIDRKIDRKVNDSPPPESSVGTIENLKKRARRKTWTQAIVGRLVYLDSPLHNQYQSAMYCSQTLRRKEDKITSKYCNSRACNVCNGIRTAKLWQGYVEHLQMLDDVVFGTLTIPNCTHEELRGIYKKMSVNWRKILDVFRKQGVDASGVRKIETTYNPKTNLFHPHYHFLINGGIERGNFVIDEWLKRNPNAVRKAQHVRIADKGAMAELFKYTTKDVCSSKKGSVDMYTPALDKILVAMSGKRCFQPFGSMKKKVKKVTEDVDKLETQDYKGLPENEGVNDESFYPWNGEDWTIENGKGLTGYKKPKFRINFFE